MNLMEQARQIISGIEIIQQWLGSGASTVPPEVAQSRANCCISCPLNIKGGIVSEPVALAIKRQVEVKNQLNLKVENEENLGRCQACFCESRLKIWIPLKNIEPEESERSSFDPKCWLLNEGKP